MLQEYFIDYSNQTLVKQQNDSGLDHLFHLAKPVQSVVISLNVHLNRKYKNKLWDDSSR